MWEGVIIKLRFEYRNQLETLKSQIFNMGEDVSEILCKTIDVVRDNKIQLAKKIFESDSDVDKIVRSIENDCLKIVSLQSPFASDLRIVTGSLKVVSDLERIADHCADICEIVSMKNLEKGCECSNEVVSILEKVYSIYNRTYVSCFNLDLEEAGRIYKSDDEIDLMFSKVIFSIAEAISKNSFSVFAGSDLMFVAKYAERIGDHCANISKWIVYMSIGVFPDSDYFK